MTRFALSSLAARRVFLLAIVAYLILCVYVSLFVSRVFGVRYAIGLSLILVLPCAVAVRMRSRWQELRGREFVLLLTLLILVFGTTGGLIANWYANELDWMHREDLECAEFDRILRKDPAFRDVQLCVSGKHIFWMHGTVASKTDLDRLRSMAAQHTHILWNEEVEVRKEEKGIPGDADLGKQGVR